MTSSILIGKSRLCGMSETSGACDSSDFDGSIFLVGSDDFVYNYSDSMRGGNA